MPHAFIELAVTSAAEGAHVVTALLGEIMRKRVSKTYTLETASDASMDVVVKVAEAPNPSEYPAAAEPATVEVIVGKKIAPGVVGAVVFC
jgi:hypothetical protein